MNPGFSEFLRAAPRDRRDVFLGAATRLGAPAQNVETRLLGHLDAQCTFQWPPRWPSAFSLQGRNLIVESLWVDLSVF